MIDRFSNEAHASFFIDPPYTAAGKRAGRRLYKHHELDHELLLKKSSQVKGDVVLTYDNTTEIKELAAKYTKLSQSSKVPVSARMRGGR